MGIEPDAAELAWLRDINPEEWGVSAWEPEEQDHRGQVIVGLPRGFDEELIRALRNALESQGMERQPRTLFFWTTTARVSQIKLNTAAKIIRRWKEGRGSDEK